MGKEIVDRSIDSINNFEIGQTINNFQETKTLCFELEPVEVSGFNAEGAWCSEVSCFKKTCNIPPTTGDN